MNNLPRFGLTLLAPWWAYCLWAGKDVENRSPGVASTVGDYRGPVLLTASKGHTTAKGTRRPFCNSKGIVHINVWQDIKQTMANVADADLPQCRLR